MPATTTSAPATLALLALLLGSACPAMAADAAWPQFRGPTGDGHAVGDAPLTWNGQEGVAWRTPIHDTGWSSPVVWGAQVWMTTADPKGSTLFAVCLDRDSGRVIHDVKVFALEKPQKINAENTYASPTPVIEEGRIYVHFGAHGTACLETATGKTLWSRQDITCDHEMGPGSSPILVDNLLVFHMDGMDRQYVIALDKSTGATRWSTDRSVDYSKLRQDMRKAFNTPTPVRTDAGIQLICPAADACMAYDATTGKELWKVRYKGWSNTIRTVTGNGLAFIGTDYVRPALWAVRLGGSGDITDTHVAWKREKGEAKNMPATPSPLLVEDLLYTVGDSGTVTCMEATTGKTVWEHKIAGGVNASPVLAGGRIYIVNRKGVTTVLAHGRTAQVLATNDLGDGIKLKASPAVVGGSIYIRTDQALYRIGKR